MGESLYAFIWRSVIGGFGYCWLVETRRLRRRGKSVWHCGNRLLQDGGQLLLIYAMVAAFVGVRGTLLFALQSSVSIVFLEAVNYIQHYGLQRAKIRPNRYEPVAPWHSWDSRHPVSNALLFNLGLHADHHCSPHRPYDALMNRANAPQLPAGYPIMIVIALFPPIWQWLMDDRVPQRATNFHPSATLAKVNAGNHLSEEMIP